MKKINLCPWCINAANVSGIKLYTGSCIEAKCDACGIENDNVCECIELSEEEDMLNRNVI